MTNKLSPLLLLVIGACDAQVDADHQGEVLATLQGTMQTAQSTQNVALDVVVNWVVPSGGPSFRGADRVEVEGTLPSNFSLSIYTPPTTDQMIDWQGVKYGAAYIAVVPVGEDGNGTQNWRGADYDHVLVYLPEVPPAGSEVATFLHGPTTAGYHLYNARKITEAEHRQQIECWNQLYQMLGHAPPLADVFATCGGTSNDYLFPAPDGLDTPLSIDVIDDFGVEEFNKLSFWYGLL